MCRLRAARRILFWGGHKPGKVNKVKHESRGCGGRSPPPGFKGRSPSNRDLEHYFCFKNIYFNDKFVITGAGGATFYIFRGGPGPDGPMPACGPV